MQRSLSGTYLVGLFGLLIRPMLHNDGLNVEQSFAASKDKLTLPQDAEPCILMAVFVSSFRHQGRLWRIPDICMFL